jgi:hypothetical protein
VIASSFYGPDAQGSLQAKLAVLFRVTSYSNVGIIARRITPGNDPCQKGTEPQCYTTTSLGDPAQLRTRRRHGWTGSLAAVNDQGAPSGARLASLTFRPWPARRR